MKKLIIIALILSGCGTDPSLDFPQPSQSPGTVAQIGILSKWVADPSNSSVIIPNPDFTGLTLNTMLPMENFITCTGSYGNSVVTLGVPSGQLEVRGNTQFGYMQFGNTMYYGMPAGALATECSNLSKETYIYSIANNVLTLCLENLSYPYCTTYEVSQ